MTDDLPKAPGEFLKEEIAQRGWTQSVAAEITGIFQATISQVIAGKRVVTPEMAVAFETAFGISAETWLKREADYRLSLIRRQDTSDVRKRARLYELAPVKEMERRGWINGTKSSDDLEKELCRFYSRASLDSEVTFDAVPRKSEAHDPLTVSQVAWLFRCRQLATTVWAERYDQKRFERELPTLRELAGHPEQLRLLPRTLSELGIRLVIVEHLPHTKIDGAAFWLTPEAPVVALSVRHDRIDNFWFTLMHELSHVKHHDHAPVDINLMGSDEPQGMREEMETRADNEAAEALVPKAMLDSFVLRVRPLFSKTKIIQFSNRVKVHPGIVVGQLHKRNEIGWQTNREMLVKIRHLITTTALTDGWGCTFPPA